MRRRFALPAILGVGILTYLPALRSPFLLDDYLHLSMVAGTFPAQRNPFDLYDFVSDSDRATLFARGILPWWSDPGLTIRFFRPLSSVLLWINHRLFSLDAASHFTRSGVRPLLLHLASLAWWALAVLAARALYRRLLAPRAAWIATAIFGLGAWHAIPLAWLANSEALVSLSLGTAALVAYVRFREHEGRLRDGAAAAGLFALSLLGGEYALCFTGYVAAIELARRDPIARRARGLLPFALPAAAYLAVRTALGYGTAGSGFYSDPLHDPGAFLRGVPWRLSALLDDGWLTIPSDTWSTNVRGWAPELVALGGFGLLFVPVRRALARRSVRERHAASWLLPGSMLSVLPVLAVVPSARLLGVAALGIAGVVALLLDHAWFGAAERPEPRSAASELTGFAAVLLGFAHFVHGPGTAWLTARQMRQSAVDFADHTAWLAERLPNPASARIAVVRGNAGQFFGPFALAPDGRPPTEWRILSHTGHALVLRKDERTLEIVVPSDRSVFPSGAGNLFRKPETPMHVGDQVAISGMRARILAVGDAGPTDVSFTFDRDLDAPGLTWIAEGFDGFQAADLPKPGFGAPFDP